MRRYFLRLLMGSLFLVYSLLAQTQVVPLDATGKKGVLEIHFVDSLGTPVPASVVPIVTVEDALTGRKVVDRQSDARTLTLPYGTYWLRVQCSPAYPVDKKIRIRDQFQVTIISFTLAPIEWPWGGNTVHGKIVSSRPEDQCKWVRLISAFSETDFAETKAFGNGKFIFENVRSGTYLGIVTGKNGICSITRVTIMAEPVQSIVLGGKR